MFIIGRYLYNKHCFNLTLIKSQRPTLYLHNSVAVYYPRIVRVAAVGNRTLLPTMYTRYINLMRSNRINIYGLLFHSWLIFGPITISSDIII